MHSHLNFRADGVEAETGLGGSTATKIPTKTRVPAQKSGSSRISSRTESKQLFKLSERTNSLTGVQIIGTGSYVPERVVTNAELENSRGFEPGWIEQRSGIQERRYAAPNQATSDMAIQAAKKAMADANVTAEEIDLIVVGTFTPDHITPSTACLVQNALGIDAPAVDMAAACSGFMYALVSASQYIATGNSKMALVIGADTNSRLVNPDDQGTAPLFGDGAGAVILTSGDKEQGLVCYQLGADGSGKEVLEIPAGGSANRIGHSQLDEKLQYLSMDGRAVFKWAVQALTGTVDLVLRKTDLTPEDIDQCIVHQANQRILKNASEQLNIAPEKLFQNLQRYGNTSSASIPIALDEARREGRVNPGDTLILSGFGAGLSWGTAVFKW